MTFRAIFRGRLVAEGLCVFFFPRRETLVLAAERGARSVDFHERERSFLIEYPRERCHGSSLIVTIPSKGGANIRRAVYYPDSGFLSIYKA